MTRLDFAGEFGACESRTMSLEPPALNFGRTNSNFMNEDGNQHDAGRLPPG